MANEAGDMKLLGNYRKLIDFLTAEPTYIPPNPKLTIAALNTQYTAALAAVQDAGDKLGPYKVAIGARQLAYEALSALVMRSRNVLKAAGASRQILDNVETGVRKVLGRRKTAKPKASKAAPAGAAAESNTPPAETDNSHSASQTSFENQLGNFRGLLAIYASVPDYKPNDASLKLPALTAFADDLHAKNNAVSATFVPLTQARGLRDQLLYLDDDCVVNRALLAKAFVSGELGTKSNVYKQIKGLKFERQHLK
jgi:hypothetical protein